MKVALITGAAKRIGKVIAHRLLDDGYHLLLHAHTSMDELNEWVSRHPRRDQVINCVMADLADDAGQNFLIQETIKNISSLDLLLHNASAFSPKKFSQLSRDRYRSMMGINLDAPFFITQGLLPLLGQAQSPSVINIIDAEWQYPRPHYSDYAVSKAGLAILTRSLALELAPHIRVNAIAPGPTIFPNFYTEEVKKTLLESIPLKRLTKAADIAEAVIFLHEKIHTSSGEILVLDGGRSLV